MDRQRRRRRRRRRHGGEDGGDASGERGVFAAEAFAIYF